jgi:hypothetical protein
MKFFLSLIFSFMAIVSIGQVTKQIKPVRKLQPVIFLDSVKMDNVIFDPNQIENVRIEKGFDSINHTQGEIYVTSKNPKEHYFLSLDDIKAKYTKDTKAPVLFMLNNDFVQNNISTLKIDSSYILNVEILRGADFDNLKENIPSLTIIRIKTKTKENLEEADRIYIRGRELSKTK